VLEKADDVCRNCQEKYCAYGERERGTISAGKKKSSGRFFNSMERDHLLDAFKRAAEEVKGMRRACPRTVKELRAKLAGEKKRGEKKVKNRYS